MSAILVTGGAGFIGSAVVRRLVASGQRVVTLDKLTYSGSLTSLRDVEAVPIVAELQAARLAHQRHIEDGLASGWGVRGKAATRLRAAIGLALDFFTWRTLHERGLTRADAIAVTASAVRAAQAT